MHVNPSVSLCRWLIPRHQSVFYMRGSLNMHCRSLLIKREVNHEHVCNSSYESHLALYNSVIYAFDNSNRDAFSNNKVALKDDNNGTLVSLEMKRCLALWQPFFSLLFFYLFYLSPCASLYLIKGYWWRKMWSQFSICDRTPPSSCEEAAVCSIALATSHPHTYFRWLVLLTVTVTEKNMCLLHIFNRLYWSFFWRLFLKPDKDLNQHHRKKPVCLSFFWSTVIVFNLFPFKEGIYFILHLTT